MQHVPLKSDEALSPYNVGVQLRGIRWRAIGNIVRADGTNVNAAPGTRAFTIVDAHMRGNRGRDTGRAVGALEAAGVVRRLPPADNGDYTWTPAGRAIARAISKAPTFGVQNGFKLFDLLSVLPASVLAGLTLLPSSAGGTVTDFSYVLGEAEVLRIRPRTGKIDLNFDRRALIDFFACHPEMIPHPSSLVIPEGDRHLSRDRIDIERMHRILIGFYNEFWGVEAATARVQADDALDAAGEFDFAALEGEEEDTPHPVNAEDFAWD